VAGFAYGQNKPKTTQNKQGKQALRDNQMDNLTAAGDPSIAANNSTVTSFSTSTVNLSGSTLSGASGINIVSSADATVANGANVYDSSLTTDATAKGADVNQVNNIGQATTATGTLSGYHRGQNSQLTVNKSSDVTASDNSSSRLTTSFNHNTTDNKSSTDDNATNNSASASFSTSENSAQQASASKRSSLDTSASASDNNSKSSSTSNSFAAAIRCRRVTASLLPRCWMPRRIRQTATTARWASDPPQTLRLLLQEATPERAVIRRRTTKLQAVEALRERLGMQPTTHPRCQWRIGDKRHDKCGGNRYQRLKQCCLIDCQLEPRVEQELSADSSKSDKFATPVGIL
jgi:hypothetical protein